MLSAYVWSEDELARLELQAAFGWAMLEPRLREVGLRPGARVADVGCGPGGLARRLAGAVGPTGAVTGVDVDAALLARAAALPRLPDAAPTTWVHADGRDAPLPEGSQDLILVHAVLQHVRDPQRLVDACAWALKPGGALAVVDADDALLAFVPPAPELDAFVTRTAAVQADRGGDRTVGRRLAGLLHRAGLHDVRPGTHFWTAPPHPGPVWLTAAVLARAELLPAGERLAAVGAVREAFARHEAAGGHALFGAYVVTGRRP